MLLTSGAQEKTASAARDAKQAKTQAKKGLKPTPKRKNKAALHHASTRRMSLAQARDMFNTIIEDMEGEGGAQGEELITTADAEEHDLDVEVDRVLAQRGAGHLVQFIKFRKGARIWIVLYQIAWRVLLSLIVTFVSQESSKQCLLLVVIALLFTVQIWQRPYERSADNLLAAFFFVLLLFVAAIEFLFAGYQEGLEQFAKFKPSINSQFRGLAYAQQALVVLPLPAVALWIGRGEVPGVWRTVRGHRLTALLVAWVRKRCFWACTVGRGGATPGGGSPERSPLEAAPGANAPVVASPASTAASSSDPTRPSSMRSSLNPMMEKAALAEPAVGSSALNALGRDRHNSKADKPTLML